MYIQSKQVAFVAFVVSVAAWFAVKKWLDKSGDDTRGVLLCGLGGFAAFSAIGFVLLTFIIKEKTSDELNELFHAPNVYVVEGVIKDFHREYHYSRGRKVQAIENFSVDSVQLSYGDALFGRFYSFSKTYNYEIKDGRQVRITYRKDGNSEWPNNFILKIEFADDW
ncbi:MAG TPA: hypothetical protein VFL76_06790 [Edaphocola sp.]|nr:hypothetical protein [Edaphocola sp.]